MKMLEMCIPESKIDYFFNLNMHDVENVPS